MAIPDYQSLMRPLLACAINQGETTISQCAIKIAPLLNLSKNEVEMLLPSGKQTILSNRLHWAKFYMSKAGIIESTKRGFFKTTDRAKEILNDHPHRIDNETLLKYPEFKEFQKNTKTSNNDIPKNVSTINSDESSPEEKIEQAYISLHTTLKAEILDSLYNVSPSMFERIMVDLLIAMGYGGGRLEIGKALGKSGDGGVDGLIKEDELGLDVVYIQAKKYKLDATISRPDIQAFVGSLEGFNATKGVFVTTSSFSNSAREYVQKIHKRIVLLDGNDLAELMIRHEVGVRIKENYQLKRIDEDYYIED